MQITHSSSLIFNQHIAPQKIIAKSENYIFQSIVSGETENCMSIKVFVGAYSAAWKSDT